MEYKGLEPGQLLIETEYSVISAGTELAIYKGIESWAKLPTNPGYGALARVLETGSGVSQFAPGDRIFTYASHASVNVIGDRLIVKVPDNLAGPVIALAARMGQVAFTSVRTSGAQLGDFVTVQGLGLVGNLASQLFKLSGCKVIGVDVSQKRLDAASACGIDYVVNSSTEDPVEAIKKITGGEMSQVVVEATGVPTLVGTAAKFATKGGEVILLGTPRGTFDGDVVELLLKVHIASTAVVLKGAHEWIYPIYPTAGNKHSIERNVKQLIDLAASDKLHVKELISHVITPEEAPAVYQALYNRNDDYYGVVIDWTKGKG
jgi:2-desacetyl-2-hydroxyethyl bacteriochlorophyllide A dehydrogenase